MVAWPRSYWIRSRERASSGLGAMRAIVAADPATAGLSYLPWHPII